MPQNIQTLEKGEGGGTLEIGFVLRCTDSVNFSKLKLCNIAYFHHLNIAVLWYREPCYQSGQIATIQSENNELISTFLCNVVRKY